MLRELKRTPPQKPVLDAEPSYEKIHYGLHDFSQPFWEARDVRRYAYQSVFEGAAGHTYGSNSVMQFYSPGDSEKSYDAQEFWRDGIELPGSLHMKYLYELMTSVDFTDGSHNESVVDNTGFEKYDRITAFSGNDYIMIYNYSGRKFTVSTDFVLSSFSWFDPTNGEYAPANKSEGGCFIPPKNSIE